MDYKTIIENTIKFAKAELQDFESAHDWHHANRVWHMAKRIGQYENADLLIVETAALLHDIADEKLNDGNGLKKVKDFLHSQKMDEMKIEEVLFIIQNISYKERFRKISHKSLEFQVVQDADRLDAIGAVGIARAFNYGGSKNRQLWDPDETFIKTESKQDYLKSAASTIDHFDDKLFHLKDLMNTDIAKKIAGRRHQYLVDFVECFKTEWFGEDAEEQLKDMNGND